MSEQAVTQKTISGRSARGLAGLFNAGNMLAILPGLIAVLLVGTDNTDRMAIIVMFILMVVPNILWFAASIVVYILARHHPNARVGHYTQQAAYRYYAIIGVIVVAGTFYGTEVKLWLITWVIAALILLPWSLLDLWRIRKETWTDTIIEQEVRD
ncbi:MAG: hypothetical protein R6X06_06435 [Gammaproteobacteria bacterium]